MAKPSEIIRRAAERVDGSTQSNGWFSCLAVEFLYQRYVSPLPDLEPDEMFEKRDCAEAFILYDEMLKQGEFLSPSDFTCEPGAYSRRPDNDTKQHRVMAMLMVAEVLESEGR